MLESGHYILGPEVEAFEREFAAYLGAAHAVAVASGTDALELALRAAGVKPGDRVITVANTATATVAAIELAGARAVFVDIDPRTMTMDPDALEQRLARDREPARSGRWCRCTFTDIRPTCPGFWKSPAGTAWR